MAEQSIYANLDNNDSYRIKSSHGTWANARTGTGLSVIADLEISTYFSVSYWISRGFLSFDVPDFSPVPPKSAVLRIRPWTIYENSAVSPNLIMTKGFHSNPLVIANWAPQTEETENFGQLSMVGFEEQTYQYIPFNASGLTLIESAYGSTLKLCLRCQADVDNDPPVTGGHRISYGTPSSDEPHKPLLVLTFGAARSQGYIL